MNEIILMCLQDACVCNGKLKYTALLLVAISDVFKPTIGHQKHLKASKNVFM